MRTIKSLIHIAAIFISLIPAFIRAPRKTIRKVRLAIKNHKPAWYYYSLPKAYRKSIGEGYKISMARKHLFKTRAA